ncbi:MAG: acyltransferase [Clostridiales Family XIII bacterium]|jgi:peptidoglycan/LPS O-acetylase OafA/YrhL|nr:acyltransferase [Clostridiales Family XIII bacterium]
MDLLRACAAWMVLVGHGVSFFNLAEPPFPVQNLGVVLLFLISGYFTLYSIRRKTADASRPYSFRGFFIDRFARICIVYYPALLLVVGIDLVSRQLLGDAYLFGDAFNAGTFLGNLLFLQDFPGFESFAPITSFGSDRPLWALGVEWWLYMLFGYCMLVLPKRSRQGRVRLLPLLLLLPLSISPVFHIADGRANGITLTWFFGAAILLACGLRERRWGGFACCLMLLAAAVSLYAAFRLAADAGDVYFPAFTLLAGLFVFLLLAAGTGRGMHRRARAFGTAIRFFSGYSYSLFLIHYPVLVFFAGCGLPLPDGLRFAIALATSNALAIPLSLLLERRSHALAAWLHRRLAPAGKADTKDTGERAGATL